MELLAIIFQMFFNAFAFLGGLLISIICIIWPFFVVMAIVLVAVIIKAIFSKK